MNFTQYTTDNHLYLLTEGYRHLNAVAACDANVETLKYWMVLANCNACTIPGQTFDDLFPAQEVAQYRDLQGKPLDELAFEFRQHQAPKKVFYRPSGDGRIEYQLDYIRWYLIPRFAATIVNLFSGLIYTYRNQLGGEMGEPPAKSVSYPCPSLVRDGLAPEGGVVVDDGAALSPKERFFRMLEQDAESPEPSAQA